MKLPFVRAVLAASLLSTSTLAIAREPVAAAPAAALEIETESFTLPNGLRVFVNTDRRVPVVAVNLRYHVGSRNETEGRTGFAHLFEHLMYQGSENYPGEFFEPFELVGRTDQNGTTSQDRTNYFQTVPTPALDMTLWMESDRMGHFLGAVDQATLDEQRGVVKNEKRQRTLVAYASASEWMYRGMFPEGHPYRTTPIGSMADLDAATLDDVRAWFKSWYGPNNAVLVLSGDIDLATAREKVTRYFGHIPASATMPDLDVPLPRMTEDKRETIADRVTRTLITRNFIAPPEHDRDTVLLELAAFALGTGQSSRFNDRLVIGERVADGASAGMLKHDLASIFMLNAYVKEGESPERAEALLNEELERFLVEGPTAQELDAARIQYRRVQIVSAEKVGTKAELINGCVQSTGRPDCLRDTLEIVNGATANDVRDAARRWLKAPSYYLTVVPGEAPTPSPEDAEDAKRVAPPPMVVPPADPRFTTLPAMVDRSKGVPTTDQFPDFELPPRQHATLSNGMKVVLVEQREIPIVDVRMDFLGGLSVDAAKPAAPMMALSLLSNGAGEYDTQQFAQRQLALGASIAPNATRESASLSLRALSDRLPESLDLLADAAIRPRFPQAEIDRSREATIAALAQAKLGAGAMGPIVAEQLYGRGHPYDARLTAEHYEAVTRDDILAFQRKWLRPELATITVAGDTTMAQIVPLLEARFAGWPTTGLAGEVEPVPVVAVPTRPRIVLVDQPGAQQSMVIAAQLIAPGASPDADVINIATQVLGGGFNSRLNLNLREDKNWTYGAQAGVGASLGQRSWMASSSLQSDKTAEGMAEILREIVALKSGEVPISELEMSRVRGGLFAYPGTFGTSASVAAVLGSARVMGKPEDYVEQYMELVETLTPDQIQAAFAKEIDPNSLTWFVMGDLSTIEAPIRALGWSDVEILRSDGTPVPPASR